MKDPDTSKVVARLDTIMNAKKCKQECLRNCSCTAYMSMDNKGRFDCLTWYGELMDIVEHTDAGRDLWVRVDEIELGNYLLVKEASKLFQVFMYLCFNFVLFFL